MTYEMKIKLTHDYIKIEYQNLASAKDIVDKIRDIIDSGEKWVHMEQNDSTLMFKTEDVVAVFVTMKELVIE